jgi:uncharacterized protein
MKLALIGGSGFVGSAVLDEALQRGHAVTALVRDPARLAPRPGLHVVVADALQPDAVAAAVRGHDAVIDAYNPGWQAPALYDTYLAGTRAILNGIRQAGVLRVLIVGGAGSLFVAPGTQLVDTPGFLNLVPAGVVQGARAARDALTEIQADQTLEWSFLSPPAQLEPGARSGRYRIGADDLLMAGEQPAGITVADLAVAIVDELERPQHVRRRFTVAAPLA